MSQLIKELIHLAKQSMSLTMEYRGRSNETRETDTDKYYFFLNNEIRCSGKVEAYGEVLEILGMDVHKYEDIKDKHGYYDWLKKIFIQNAEEFDDIESVKGLLK